MPISISQEPLAAAVVQQSCESGLIARQPITDGLRQVAAYELFDRSTAKNAHNASSDMALIFNAMSHTGNELPVGTVRLFLNCTHSSLVSGQLDMVSPDKLVLEIGPIPGHTDAGIQTLRPTLLTLRERGFGLAFNHTVLAPVYGSWQALADYVKLDLQALKPEQLKAILAATKSRTPARVVAEKVETAEQFKTLSDYGVTLFQGYWVANPEVIKTKVVAPAQANILQLLSLVRNEGSTEAIEAVLKRDAMLGFNLMRMINACGFGLTHEVSSFKQAVMLMGLKKLFRWAALLLASSRAGGTPPVVSTTAVVRGRMMELLATGTLTPQECDNAFIVGLFSLLDELLGIPMDQALELVFVPAPVSEALRYGTGLYGPLLALTKACESSDDVAFASAALTLNFSSRHINMSHMEALIWADNVMG